MTRPSCGANEATLEQVELAAPLHLALDELRRELGRRAPNGAELWRKLKQQGFRRCLRVVAVRVDGWIDQITAQPSKPRQRAILVRSREPAVADDICDQNRRDFPDSRHGALRR